MALERAVRVRVPASGGGGRFTFGSGYLVAPGRVLTAAHVLIAPDRHRPTTKGQFCEVLFPQDNESWVPSQVFWIDPERDVAVVDVEAGTGLEPVRWGRVEGDEPLMWSAIGFPVASLDEAGRQPEHAWGETSAITQRPAQKLGLTVNSRHVRSSARGSGWAGLSGAAVFCERRLVGVVTADPSRYESSLVARRMEAVADDSSLHEALGIHVVLEAVSGRPMEPGLKDLRALLPEPVASFTGRADELHWLAEARTEPVVVTQALAGLGGIGKTALALQYAHQCFYAEHAVDLAWWFVAADRLSLCAAMAHVYEQLTGFSAGDDSVLAAERLRNWLETSPYRWLVVFDNADDPRVLDGLVPHAGGGQVLITSRRADWSDTGATVRRLGVLLPNESVALLARLTGRNDQGVQLLARELDGFAVALRQAGAFVRKTGWDYERYVAMLRTRPLSLHSEDLAGVGTTVAKVWESSLDQVVGSGRTLARGVLGVLAYFAADDIPRFLFQSSPIDGGATFVGGDPLAVELALVGLADYSLVSLESDAVSMHRLVQHLTRSYLEAQGAAATHVGTTIRLLQGALVGDTITTERVSRLLSHIAEATDHALRLLAVPEETASLLNAAAQNRLGVGQLDVARSFIDRALAVAFGSLGPDHSQTLSARHHLACWLAEAGREDEAVAQFQALIEDRVRLLGADHSDALETRSSLARWLSEVSREALAIPQFETLLEDCRRVLGPDHPETLRTRQELAGCLGSIGYVDEAVGQLRALLEDQHRVLGPNHPDTLKTRFALAVLHGDDAAGEAVEEFQALVDDQGRVLGFDHPDTLMSRGQLASWLGVGDARRVEDAIVQHRALLEDRRRVLGPAHPYTLASRGWVAYWLAQAGRTDEAIGDLETLLEDQRRVLGPDHLDTLGSRGQLASCLADAEKVYEAIVQLQDLLKDCGHILGLGHPMVLSVRRRLASCLHKAGRVNEAISQHRVLLEDALRLLGPKNPLILQTRKELTRWLRLTGKVCDGETTDALPG